MNTQGGAGSVVFPGNPGSPTATIFTFTATNNSAFNTRLLFFCGGKQSNGGGDQNNAPSISLTLAVTGSGLSGASFGVSVTGRNQTGDFTGAFNSGNLTKGATYTCTLTASGSQDGQGIGHIMAIEYKVT